MRARQLSFLPKSSKLPPAHGGSLRQGRRKQARAIDTKQALHIVLRSTKARGPWSMLHPKHQKHVDETVRRVASRHGVRLYRYANVGNHLHLLVRARTRLAFQRFLKELPGTIAGIITGARKGQALPKNETGRGFWDRLAFTRIVAWGSDFKNLELYFVKNLFEAAGLLSRKAKAAGVRVISLEGWGEAPT
jgi:REP element-mobilizing transposase RayT